jgi:hypothetical protein
MDLDQLAPVVDPDQAAIAADVYAPTDVGRRYGIERAAEPDVVIGMDRRLGPGRAVEGLRAQGQEACSPSPIIPGIGIDPDIRGQVSVISGFEVAA